MADLKAGKNVYEKMRIGDTLIRSNGEAFSPDKYLCMCGQCAFLLKDGVVEFHGINHITMEPTYLTLDEAEVVALREWLNS